MNEPTAAEIHFRSMYEATCQRVLGYALRRVDQPADAADVLAETYTIAWKRLGRIPQDDDAALPWLLTVASNIISNQRRSKRRRDRLASELRLSLAIKAPHVGPPEAVFEPLPIRQALEQLPAKEREILQLKVWDELTSEQVASLLNISTTTVRTRLHRARAHLRALLDEQEEAPTEPAGSTREHTAPRRSRR